MRTVLDLPRPSIPVPQAQNRRERVETWSEDNPEGRWRRFTYEEIAEEIVESLEAGLEGFRRVLASLEAPNGAAEPGEAGKRS